MPDEFIQTGQTWLDNHPGWQMRTWTEQNIPKLKNQHFFDNAEQYVESRLLGRFRSNIARLEIMHKFGGVYIDCDFVSIKPIPNQYLSADLFLPRENDLFVNNGMIGAKARHPWLKTVIEAVPESILSQPGKPSNVTCGPHLLTRLLTDKATIIPQHEVYPYGWRATLTGEIEIPESAWAHHLWAGSRHQVSVIVPWQPGDPDREANWHFVRNWMRANLPNSWQIVEATHDSSPFSKAAAVLEALPKTFGKIIVVHDADVIAPDITTAVEAVKNKHKWAIPHTDIFRLSQSATIAVRSGEPTERFKTDLAEPPYRGVVGGGVVVLLRELFEQCPPDRQFVGWGGEDEAWGLALGIISEQRPFRSTQPLFHLWHTLANPPDRKVESLDSKRLLNKYRSAAKRKHEMMRLVKQVVDRERALRINQPDNL